MVKNLPAMRGIRVWSLVGEDHLEEGVATHSSILAWRIPWTEEPGSYSPWGHGELDTTEWITRLKYFMFTLSCFFFLRGEWNGKPLHYSCLENPYLFKTRKVTWKTIKLSFCTLILRVDFFDFFFFNCAAWHVDQQEMESPAALHWNHGVLITGPLGKS